MASSRRCACWFYDSLNLRTQATMTRGLKTALIWGFLIAIVVLVLVQRDRNVDQEAAFLSTESAVSMIESGEIAAYQFDEQGLVLISRNGAYLGIDPLGHEAVSEQLSEARIPYLPVVGQTGETDLVTWLVILAIVAIAVIYLLRKMGSGNMNRIFELRKSKARPVEEADRAKFCDIGGNRDAIEVLEDVVDYLRSPQKWTSAGTRLPRGILMVGPPGSGKTLLARAVAGETQSSFFYTSASEFVEMFVGVGAARVRDTFEKAVAKQPAVIFIDELDAIGRRRGSGVGTMHEEREQALNQLLVLLDGMERHDRLVVMAATNRPDILDPALLRSGRFDRVLRIQPPTGRERLDILKIHVRKKPLHESVALERIAEQTEGFTGADLEALTNDAALLAVRRVRLKPADRSADVQLTSDDFERALASMKSSNRQFNRLDAILIESVSQFAEPTGRALAKVRLTTGTVVSGEVLWMNMVHIKLRTDDGSEIVVAKDMAEQIESLEGTEQVPQEDVIPDRWAGRSLEVG
jgi:ATP-dependent Zn protease